MTSFTFVDRRTYFGQYATSVFRAEDSFTLKVKIARFCHTLVHIFKKGEGDITPQTSVPFTHYWNSLTFHKIVSQFYINLSFIRFPSKPVCFRNCFLFRNSFRVCLVTRIEMHPAFCIEYVVQILVAWDSSKMFGPTKEDNGN